MMPLDPDEAADLAAARAAFRALRGRWMVVERCGYAYRARSKAEARRLVNAMVRVGIPAHVRRYRRRDVVVHNGTSMEIARQELYP